MLVTEAGIIIDVKSWQLLNALCPMLVSKEPVSNVTDVKDWQLVNVPVPMLLTEAGMIIDVKAEP